jgi:hypothetical protein
MKRSNDMPETYTTEELKAIDKDGFRHACLWLIETNFDLDSGSTEEDHLLYGIPRKDFYRGGEDVIETWVDKLDHLEIDYSTELSSAEKMLTEIVNGYVTRWGTAYSLEQCVKDVPDRGGVFYLMVGSALGSGIGLWEEIGQDLDDHCGYTEGIDCYDIQTKVAQCYKREEEDDRE